jgi:hypothetical protein
VRNNSSDVNVGQIGLSLTVHKFRQPEHARPADMERPVAAPEHVDSFPSQAPGSSSPSPIAAPAATPSSSPPAESPPAVPADEAPPAPSGPIAPFVGDTRLKLFYPSACAAKKGIPPQFRVLFQSAAGAQRDGFRPSGDC